jgi:hypothetical protein
MKKFEACLFLKLEVLFGFKEMNSAAISSRLFEYGGVYAIHRLLLHGHGQPAK